MIDRVNERFAARAVFRLSLVEFWERYSFFTTFALMALFVAAPVGEGGMGWNNAQSLRFFGAYLLAVQLTPILGGYLADRRIGRVRALHLGAISLTFGHSLLATAAFMPWWSQTGRPLSDAALAAGLPLGLWHSDGLATEFGSAYFLTTLAFYAGVALIAIGNGLFKPILTVVVGKLPHADEAARTRAFTTFFMYINMGGILSILFGGWLAQRFGWGWAFCGSAIGMLVAIATLGQVERKYIRPFAGTVEAGAEGKTRSRVRPAELIPIGALLVLLVIAATFSFQSYGFVSLFSADLVRRDLGSFEIPPSWFTALNPITIMLLTPILLAYWKRGGTGSQWSTTQHFAAALLLMAVGFVPLVAASLEANAAGLANPLWVAGTVILIAASELLYAPAALAASTRLAPQSMQTMAIGAQGAAIGVGGWLSGQVGAIAFELGKVEVMSAVAAATAGAAIGLWAWRRQAARLGL